LIGRRERTETVDQPRKMPSQQRLGGAEPENTLLDGGRRRKLKLRPRLRTPLPVWWNSTIDLSHSDCADFLFLQCLLNRFETLGKISMPSWLTYDLGFRKPRARPFPRFQVAIRGHLFVSRHPDAMLLLLMAGISHSKNCRL